MTIELPLCDTLVNGCDGLLCMYTMSSKIKFCPTFLETKYKEKFNYIYLIHIRFKVIYTKFRVCTIA